MDKDFDETIEEHERMIKAGLEKVRKEIEEVKKTSSIKKWEFNPDAYLAIVESLSDLHLRTLNILVGIREFINEVKKLDIRVQKIEERVYKLEMR